MNEVRFSNYFIEKRTSHFWGALLYKVFPYGFAVFISHFFSKVYLITILVDMGQRPGLTLHLPYMSGQNT